MPVPSSYNDITTNSTIRDYVGWSWYQYEFYAPKRWIDDHLNVFLRFGSVHFKSIVVNIFTLKFFCIMKNENRLVNNLNYCALLH